MTFFLQLLLFIVLFIILSVIIMAVVLYQHVKRFLGFGRTKNFSFGRTYGSWKNTTTDSDGPVVVDQRSRQQSERKIFSQDEGEYVEFEESKD